MKKKVFILFTLLALPICVYIAFSTAVHHFSYLPVLNKNIARLDDFESLRGEDIQLKNKFTVLCFFGEHINLMQGNAYNLYEGIYKEFHIYKDFQIVILVKEGTQDKVRRFLDELHDFTHINVDKWKFAFGSSEEIQHFFNSLNTDLQLDKNKSTPFVFIIDQDGYLRGRKTNENPAYESVYGYDTQSVGTLHTKMVDDIKVLFAEYRLKLQEKKRDITTHKE